jgi:hypothetical protein
VLAILKRVPDRVEQALYLQQLARLVNVEERTLADALAHAPVVRRPQRAPAPTEAALAGAENGRPLDPLEAEALELMLRHPALAAELAVDGQADEALPFREAVAVQLARSLRERGSGLNASSLEAFVAELDPASGALARDLLAAAAARTDEPRLDSAEAREVLRTCLLRLREERIEEDIRDGRILLEEAQREGNGERLAEIEQRLTRLGLQKAEVTKAMRTPATFAGARR